MAGEVKGRIEFGNNVVQEQAVWQILPQIVSKKRSKDQLLSEKEHHHIKELEVLWDKCNNHCHIISLAAVGVFVELVYQNVADFSYVMNGFLNRVASSRHLLGPIRGVTELLCYQMKNATKCSPYSLRSTSHPYVSILASSPEAWPILLLEIENLFENSHNSSLESVFAIFDPFFKYVLFNPKTDHAVSTALHSLLLNVASEVSPSNNRDVLDNILILVTSHCRLYKRNRTSLGHSVSLCHQTLKWILKKDEVMFGM